MRVLAVALPATLSTMGAAQPPWPQRGQKDIEQHPIIGVLSTAQWYADSTVIRNCPSFVLADSGVFKEGRVGHRPSASIRSWCNVDTSYALPSADRTRWLTVVYNRSFVPPADSVRRTSPGTADTVVLVTAVLYKYRDHILSWSPEWMGTVERELTWSISLHTAERPDRSMLVGMRYCINGTGGCWQRYLRRQDGNWTAIEEHFWKQIPGIPGGRIGKGAGIDLRTLSGSYGVYFAADANCCPSRQIFLTLDLRGDTLMLARHELRRTTR